MKKISGNKKKEFESIKNLCSYDLEIILSFRKSFSDMMRSLSGDEIQ